MMALKFTYLASTYIFNNYWTVVLVQNRLKGIRKWFSLSAKKITFANSSFKGDTGCPRSLVNIPKACCSIKMDKTRF